MKDSKDRNILEGILNHDPEVINSLYRHCFPKIEKMVLRNGGDNGNAKDIFQDAMIIIYRKICNNDLSLSCRLSTYIYAICKNLWIQDKRGGKYILNSPVEEFDMVSDAGPVNDYEQKIMEIFDRQFARLSKDCQRILQMHFKGRKIEDIRKALNYSNIHHAMDRKYRCKSSLIKKIMNDPEFKELTNETKKEDDPIPRRNAE